MSRVIYEQRRVPMTGRGVAMRRIRELDGPLLQPYVVEVVNRWDWNQRPRPVFWASKLADAYAACELLVETEVVHR